MHQSINLIQHNHPLEPRQKRKKSWLRRIFKLIILLLAALFVISFALSSKAIFSQVTFGQALSKLPGVSQIRGALGYDDEIITGEDKDRINFLLLGIGGAGHDGGLLTDTIMLASVQLSTKRAVITSIPRDLYVKIPGNGYQRINNASAYGDLNNYPGGGSALMAKTIEETFGVPIHYYLRIDFVGFKKVIDTIGGVDIYITNGFTDNEYPTADYGYETVTFEQRTEHMDGERALVYARSRHGDNGEGSDFARSKRQQQIIFAVKQKLLNLKMLTKPKQLFNVLEEIDNHTQTNITAWNFPELIGLVGDIDVRAIDHYVIDDGPGGLVKPIMTDGGAFVLAPKTGDLSELQEFMQNIFVIENISDNNIGVIVANGTSIEGLATHIGAVLSSWGFSIDRLITSPQQDFEKTVIYDLTGGQQTEILKILKNRFDANVAQGDAPEFLNPLLYRYNNDGEQEKIPAEFLVIVGADQTQAIEAVEEWQEKQAMLESQAEEGGGNEEDDNRDDKL